MRRAWARIRALWVWFRGRDRLEADMDEEFASHVALRADDLERSGVPRDEAMRRARVEFGGEERFKEQAREVRGLPLVESLVQDVGYALRTFRRAPVFSVVAILTLALGVGAATAIFSVVDAVLLRPPPFRDPGRLVEVWEESRDEGWSHGTATPADFFDWRERTAAFADAAGYGTGISTVSGDGLAEAVATGWVTGTFFDVLGTTPRIGRGFRPEETWSDAEPVVVVSDELWARRWGRDPSVVGSTVLVDEVPRRVVGVMGPGLSFPELGTQLWLPMEWSPEGPGQRWFRDERFVFVVARLRRDVSVEAARGEIGELMQTLARERPDTNRGIEAGLTPLTDALTGAARAPLTLLFGATGLLLLLTCANLANLLLVRAGERSDEIALRAALGARRGRIARQLLTESLTLALLGGALGLGLGVLGTGGLLALQPPGIWRVADVPVDLRVVSFALLATLMSGTLFGLAPLLQVPRAVRGGGRRSSDGRGARLTGRVLVVSEVALSVMLVAGAALILRTFVAVRSVDPGFEIEDRTSVSLVLPSRYDSDAAILALVDEVSTRLGALPGVGEVAYASRPPMGGAGTATYLQAEGRGEEERGLVYAMRLVGPSWFRAAGVPVDDGRVFVDGDVQGAEPVALINRTFARRVFGDENPVGQRVTRDEDPATRQWLRIVGVVGDEHQDALRMPAQPELLYSFRWLPSRRITFLVHAEPGARLDGEVLRRAIADVDPALSPYALQRLEDVYGRALAPERFLLTLIGTFSVLALVLAALGVYGVAAGTTQRRTREIGIRVALGATPTRVARLVGGEGLGLAVTGIAAGSLGAWIGGGWMTAVTYGVDPRDASTLVGAALTLALVALAACARPVLGATRLDPGRTIRAE